MSELEQATREMLANPDEAFSRPQERFIEVLTWSSFEEIVGVLDRSFGEFSAMPVWARHLAYRLACLLAPGDANILLRAAGELRLFGPDWDHIADELEQRARLLTPPGG